MSSLNYFVVPLFQTIKMTGAISDQVEDHIRTLSLTKRIRPSEFFLDFDRLRSGYVTGEDLICVYVQVLCYNQNYWIYSCRNCTLYTLRYSHNVICFVSFLQGLGSFRD